MLSIILIVFIFKSDQNYYPQVFLEEYKYVKNQVTTLKFLLKNSMKLTKMIKMTNPLKLTNPINLTKKIRCRLKY